MGAGLDKMRQMVEAGTNQRSTGSTDLGGGTHLKIPGPNVAGVVRTNLKYEDPMRSCGDEKIPGPNVAGVVRTNLKYEDPMRSSGDANQEIPDLKEAGVVGTNQKYSDAMTSSSDANLTIPGPVGLNDDRCGDTNLKDSHFSSVEEDRALADAHAWLESQCDGKSRSVGVATSGRENNEVISASKLRDNFEMWDWCLSLLEKDQNSRTGVATEEAPRIDFARLRRTILEGIHFEFKPGMGSIPKYFRKNYFQKNSAEWRWYKAQFRAMVQGGKIRLVDRSQVHMIHPCFLVRKGEKGWRLIVDLREFNKYLELQKFSLITLNKRRYDYYDLTAHDTTDLTSGYDHLGICTQHQRYIGIQCEDEVAVFVGAPFGTAPLPGIFQEMASVPVRVNRLIGVSDRLLTEKAWTNVALTNSLPHRKYMVSISMDNYLDDYSHRHPNSTRSKANVMVPAHKLRQLIPKWSKSFRCLLGALGLTVGRKSCLDPFAPNPFLGFIILPEPKGGRFRIMELKRQKNLKIFREALQQTSWTFRQTSALASRILQFKLIWSFLASLWARPLYFHLAQMIKTTSTWEDEFFPSELDQEMISRVIKALEGPNQMLEAPVIDSHQQKIMMWEAHQWDSFRDSNGRRPELIFGDASAWRVGTFMTSFPMDVEQQHQERDITENGTKLQTWIDMTIEDRHLFVERGDAVVHFVDLSMEEIRQSSSYRELVCINTFYADKTVQRKIRERMRRLNKYSMLHATDSQVVRNMLHKGASSVPECQLLILNILDNTAELRRDFGLFFGWVPREHHAAQVADSFSKVAGWRIKQEIFLPLHQRYNFTMDAYASLDERVSDAEGRPLEFCSRSTHEKSRGDGRYVSWEGETVWAFPPPAVDLLIHEAMIRCTEHDGTAVFVLPGWVYHKFKAKIFALPWTHFFNLGKSAARKVVALKPGTTEIQYKDAKFQLLCFVFEKKKKKKKKKKAVTFVQWTL